jgi:hypothetical protein
LEPHISFLAPAHIYLYNYQKIFLGENAQEYLKQDCYRIIHELRTCRTVMI